MYHRHRLGCLLLFCAPLFGAAPPTDAPERKRRCVDTAHRRASFSLPLTYVPPKKLLGSLGLSNLSVWEVVRSLVSANLSASKSCAFLFYCRPGGPARIPPGNLSAFSVSANLSNGIAGMTCLVTASRSGGGVGMGPAENQCNAPEIFWGNRLKLVKNRFLRRSF